MYTLALIGESRETGTSSPFLPTILRIFFTEVLLDKCLNDLFFHVLKSDFHRKRGLEGTHRAGAFVGECPSGSKNFLPGSSISLDESSSFRSSRLSKGLKSVIESQSHHNQISRMIPGIDMVRVSRFNRKEIDATLSRGRSREQRTYSPTSYKRLHCWYFPSNLANQTKTRKM